MTLRLALLSDSAPEPLARALAAEAARRGLALDLRTWGFTWPTAVAGELAAFAPEAVLVWACAEAGRFPHVAELCALPYPFYLYNMVVCDDGTCGSLALTYADARRARCLAWNQALYALAKREPRIIPLDLEGLVARIGRDTAFDPRLWEACAMALTPAVLPAVARHTLNELLARRGSLRKVLVTDLDGTLWAGTLSETGPAGIDPDAPGFATYRQWLQALAKRGILLAIASRNDRPAVLEALAKHAIDPASFAAIEVDWGDKPAMLRRIAERLHVALDALVFIDDRPEQRAAVREALPAVAVPEIPEDPACRPTFLAAENLFVCAQITAEDALRTQALQADEARRASAAPALSPEAYGASLGQTLIAEPLGPGTLERAAQLTQRCNQFNMRGTRHTADDLRGKRGWVYRLTDHFGDMGIISAVILEGPLIETWVLSCRALNRGVEALILNHLRQQGPLVGEYLPTARNARCKGLYEAAGFPVRAPATQGVADDNL